MKDAEAIAALDQIVKKTTATATWRSRNLAAATAIQEDRADFWSPVNIRAMQSMRDANGPESDNWTFATFVVMTGVMIQAEGEREEEDSLPGGLFDQMAAIEKANGLSEDEYYTTDDAPPEWIALHKEEMTLHDEAVVKAFREYGASDLADLYQSDRLEFDRLLERGRRNVFGEDIPEEWNQHCRAKGYID